MMAEQWRDVAGFPGYRISDAGRVAGPRGHIIRGDGVRGYTRVTLCGETRERRLVHHLVLEAFAGARPTGAIARHLSGDHSDNRAVNLAWGTPAENAADRERHGRTARGESNGSAKLSDAQIAQIRAIHAIGLPARAIGRAFKISGTHVLRILRGELRANP